MIQKLKQIIEYRKGMLEKGMKLDDLPVKIWCGANILKNVRKTIHEEDLFNLGGVYGDKNAGGPVEYDHNGFVQVIVFADRVEVWNPGELPPGLTPDLLRQPHGPIPRNPLIAEPLFQIKYAEKVGTGTTDMIEDCRAAFRCDTMAGLADDGSDCDDESQ